LTDDNTLSGGGGNDTLVGIAGQDTLTGGANADTFLYRNVADSVGVGPGPAAFDIVVDFTQSQSDRVDLRAIAAIAGTPANDTFIGSAIFGSVAGQLRFEATGPSDTKVEADVNGDGVADLFIKFTGAITFMAADFVL
jgi:serralysin